ncbi:MAG TPA: Xaa-Pro peptidase family protein [bacterium]|nr:Xaa-Pro peptidase family protein [bacterium]
MCRFVEFKNRRIQAALAKHNLTALIASLPENIDYLSGYKSIGHEILNRTQLFSLYLAGENCAALVIPTAEVPTAVERLPKMEKVCFGDFTFATPATGMETILAIINDREEDSFQALVRTLTAGGIKNGRVGVDEGRITPQLWQGLAEALPGVEFVPAADIFYEIRAIKHQAEIDNLEQAAEIAEQALLSLLPTITVGTTELEMERVFMEEVASRGGKPYFNVMTVDERSAFVDTISTNQPVQDGSVLRFDFGCIYKGYCSDLARTAVFGGGDGKVHRYYEAILAGEDQAIKQLCPGISAEEIFRIAVNETKRAGIAHYDRHHCGHGIGLEIYDHPLIAPGVKTPLEVGMVLCIETPYYELGWGGIQVEDTIVITEQGARFLSKSSRDLIRLG